MTVTKSSVAEILAESARLVRAHREYAIGDHFRVGAAKGRTSA